MHPKLSNVEIFFSHPAGLICLACAVVAFVGASRLGKFPLLLLLAGMIISGAIGYAQVP